MPRGQIAKRSKGQQGGKRANAWGGATTYKPQWRHVKPAESTTSAWLPLPDETREQWSRRMAERGKELTAVSLSVVSYLDRLGEQA